jgi:hypothetical protein
MSYSQIQIIGNQILAYPGQDERTSYEMTEEHKEKLKKSKKFKGQLSKHSKRKIHKYLKIWHEAIRIENKFHKNINKGKRKKLVFITLTLPAAQMHSDKYVKKNILGRFLEELQRKNYTTHYFWRAEKQKNGNIHFHCITDNYIDKKILQNLWNHEMRKHGYIEKFKKKHGHENPPSTQVQVLPETENGINYVTKYQEKEDENGTVEGRLWACDYNLVKLRPYVSYNDSSMNYYLSKVTTKEDVYIYNDDFFCYYSSKEAQKELKKVPEIYIEYIEHYHEQYQVIYGNPDIKGKSKSAKERNKEKKEHEKQKPPEVKEKNEAQQKIDIFTGIGKKYNCNTYDN